MPLITRRSSTRGLPRVSVGNSASSRANWSAVNQKQWRIHPWSPFGDREPRNHCQRNPLYGSGPCCDEQSVFWGTAWAIWPRGAPVSIAVALRRAERGMIGATPLPKDAAQRPLGDRSRQFLARRSARNRSVFCRRALLSSLRINAEAALVWPRFSVGNFSLDMLG